MQRIKNSSRPALLTTPPEKILARGLNPEGHPNPNLKRWKKTEAKMVEICNFSASGAWEKKFVNYDYDR